MLTAQTTDDCIRQYGPWSLLENASRDGDWCSRIVWLRLIIDFTGRCPPRYRCDTALTPLSAARALCRIYMWNKNYFEIILSLFQCLISHVTTEAGTCGTKIT